MKLRKVRTHFWRNASLTSSSIPNSPDTRNGLQDRDYPPVAAFQAAGGDFPRGVYDPEVWYLHLTSPDYPGRTGIGECAPLPALSCDDLPDYEDILAGACRRLEQCGGELDADALRDYPSILFGLETALRHLLTGSWALYDTDFSQGKAGIPINGLIWMATLTRCSPG